MKKWAQIAQETNWVSCKGNLQLQKQPIVWPKSIQARCNRASLPSVETDKCIHDESAHFSDCNYSFNTTPTIHNNMTSEEFATFFWGIYAFAEAERRKKKSFRNRKTPCAMRMQFRCVCRQMKRGVFCTQTIRTGCTAKCFLFDKSTVQYERE